MAAPNIAARTRERFLLALRHHFQGWINKARQDFGDKAFADELSALSGDELYTNFGLASPEYAIIRLMGRMSVSFGRRLAVYVSEGLPYIGSDEFPAYALEECWEGLVAQLKYSLREERTEERAGYPSAQGVVA
jgi:hypothetical protein